MKRLFLVSMLFIILLTACAGSPQSITREPGKITISKEGVAQSDYKIWSGEDLGNGVTASIDSRFGIEEFSMTTDTACAYDLAECPSVRSGKCGDTVEQGGITATLSCSDTELVLTYFEAPTE